MERAKFCIMTRDLEGYKEESNGANQGFVFRTLWEWLLERHVFNNGGRGGSPLSTKPYSVLTCLCIKLCTQEKKVPDAHPMRRSDNWWKGFCRLFTLRMKAVVCREAN